jgi:hypothetical protein
MRRSLTNTRAPEGLESTNIPPDPLADAADDEDPVVGAAAGMRKATDCNDTSSAALGCFLVKRTRRSTAANPSRVT